MKRTTCRGCAGTGIGQHVTPRTIAVLETIGYTFTFEPIAVASRRRIRSVVVGRTDHDTPRLFGRRVLPLAEALELADDLLADGFTYNCESIPLDPAWKCEWCHGTGTPQLSIGTMQVAAL